MNVRKTLLSIFWIFGAGTQLFSQGIQDSVYQLKEVIKTSEYIFRKEEAGMKEIQLDTLAILDKVNVNLSDLLQQNSSIYIKSYGRGALATASFRGTAPTHTIVTWNGMNINSPMLGMVDFSTIPVYVLDNINIQFGGASISSNSGALGGNINLSNKVDWKNSFSGRLLQSYGSYSTYNTLGQINVGNKKIQSKTRAYYNYSKNDYEFVNKHIIGFPTEKNNHADYIKLGVLQELYTRFSRNWISSAKVWYQNIERSIPMVMSYEGSDTINRENNQTDITLKAIADAKYYGKKLKCNIHTGLDYQQLDYVVSIDVGGLGTQKPVNSGSDMRSWYNHAGASYVVSEKLSFKSSFDINYFDITSLDSSNQTGYDEKRLEYSAFIATYYTPFTQLNLLLELRKDKIPNTSPPIIYNFGLSLKPFQEADLVWKSSFSRNFHNPTLNDLYWVPGGNPDLLAEKGYTGESGLHYIITKSKTRLEIQTTGYYSDIDNWILWLPSIKGYWEAMNLKRVVSWGIELNGKLQHNFGNLNIKLLANYAFTSTRNQGEPINDLDASVGMQLPFIPENSGNILANLSYKNSFINYQYQYYGVRNLLSSNLATLEDDSGDESLVPFYRLYAVPFQNLSIGHKQIIGKYSLLGELKIYNLFNETYRNVLNRFMPGRNYKVLLTLKF